MTIRPEHVSRHPGDQQTHFDPARRRALERAYPLAKELAEILELEAIEPLATSVKHVRQAIGAELAEHGALDPGRLDPAETADLTHRALEEDLDDGR